jgi:APA family basic amino acid/polyamine antiporter
MKPPLATPSGSGLVRVLGPLTATAVVVGTVIGTGVFKKPQSVAESIPFFGVAALVWVAGGLFALLGALAYAEVAVLLPRAGGNYVFLREGYGRLAGFLWGWVDFCIIRSASLAALATIFTESLHDVLTNTVFQQAVGLPADTRLDFWTRQGITVGLLVALAAINVAGVRWGGLVQLLITLVKVASLVAIAVLPFLVLAHGGPASAVPRAANLQPAWPASWGEVSLAGVNTAFLGVLWAYHGWMNVTPVAEEVRRPQRNLPLALLAGVGIIIALYLGANLAYALVLPRDTMAGLKDTIVATAFGQALLGPQGGVAVSAAIMASTFGALNGNLLVGPRLLYAMGEDGLAPQALREIHPRYHTPARAIGVLTVWATILLLCGAAWTQIRPGKSLFDILTDLAMFGAVIFETLAVWSIFVFRRRRPDAERPYRCVGYPLVPALYVLLPAFVLVNMFLGEKERLEALAGAGFIAVGVVVYFLLGLGKTGADRRQAGAAPGGLRGCKDQTPPGPLLRQRRDPFHGGE